MRQPPSTGVDTPPETPPRPRDSSLASISSESPNLDLSADPQTLTPAPSPLPSPFQFRMSVNAPTSEGIYIEASVKCYNKSTFPKTHDLFTSTATSEIDDDDHSSNGSALQPDIESLSSPTTTAASDSPISNPDPSLPLVLSSPQLATVLPYRNRSFQQAFKTGVSIAQDISATLQKCPKDGAPTKLSTEAQSLSKSLPPKERIVGIVGLSGHGKSSLINSMLDIEDLAMTDASGAAVTAFVIEYRQRLSHHTAPYTVTCSCLAGRELSEHLEYLLEDYRGPELTDLKTAGAPEFERLQIRSRGAKDVFQAAFQDIDGFDLEAINYDDKDLPKSAAIEQLSKWSEKLDWPADMTDGSWTRTAEDAETCQSLTAIFQQRGLWPFMESMCVYLDSELLREGLVPADLPGYHDVNFARVRAAKQYEANCDDLFVVADIKRALDNPTIHDVVKGHLCTSGNAGNLSTASVTVICTHSAELSDKKKIEKLVDEKSLKHAKTKVAALDATGKASRQQFREVDHAYDALLIDARNTKVIKDLRAKYRAEFPDSALSVYCVDNQMYWERLCRNSVETSRIPALRMYAKDLPAKVLFKAANSFLATRIPGFIASFDLWAESINRKATSAPHFEIPSLRPVESYEDDIGHWKSEVMDIIRTELERPLARIAPNIRTKSLDVCESWHSMHHSSVAAWFRNNGTHETSGAGYKCWNTELISCFPQKKKWPTIEERIREAFAQMSNDINKRFKKFKTKCRNAKAPKTLVAAIRSRRDIVKDIVESAEQDFLKGLHLIQRRATSGNPASYMVDYMLPVYRKGACDRGTGVTARRHDLLETHVRSSKYVSSHCACVRSAVEALVDRTASSITTQVEETLDLLAGDIDTFKSLTEVENSLFQRHPTYAKEVEVVLAKAKGDMETVDALAKEAREEASVLYGGG